MSQPSQPAAIITGGASGIGQALAGHLVKKGWKVTIADFNEANGNATVKSLGPDVSFVYADVTKFDQQVAMFKHAFAFGGNRLDFFAANAGVVDTQDFFAHVPVDANGDPIPLDMRATEIDLTAVIQGSWLYRHYAAKNPTPGGKIVVTSSSGGLYASPMKPQYVLSKHALVGFTRSIATPCLVNDNITVNAICPSLILTPLCPPEVAELFPKEKLTHMTTALRAFDKIIDDGTITGRVFELIIDEIIERQQVPYANEHARWNAEDGLELFKKGYEDYIKKK